MKKSYTFVWYLVVLVLIAVGFGSAYYFYTRYSSLKTNPNIQAQQEVDDLMVRVGKLMELPTDELPTVATVLDKDKIKDQKFFTNAENGDKLLAFTKAMKAVLYRPSTNKIVEVAPIIITAPQQEGQAQQQSEPTTKKIAPSTEETR